jgi:PAS domain-containing protein
MERLGCPADEARAQLARLAAEAGMDAAVMAADITAEHLPALPAPARRRAARADAAIAAGQDAAELAEALLVEALAAEGAEAVALWVLAPDGGIELAGQAGFGPLEAARWHRIPPGVPSLPLRVVQRDTEIWWPSGRPSADDIALIGRPGCARAVVPLRQAGSPAGALEACWPATLPEFDASVRRQLSALATPCARALAAGIPSTGYSRAWILGLLDGVHPSVLSAQALRGEHGNLTGFVIDWASPDFRDPAGRTAAVTGRHLAETYPAAAYSDLPGAATRVLASGQPERIAVTLPDGSTAQAAIARLFDGVVIAWHDTGETERLTALLETAQWLGNTGGWEENLLTGQARWTPAAFALFGLPPTEPVRLAALAGRVPADDIAAVESFQNRLLLRREPATAAFRITRGDDGSVRQLRAYAQPLTGPSGDVIAIRGAWQDVSDRYHTQTAFTATRQQLAGTEERARAEHQLAVRLQQAIIPQVSQPVETAGIDVVARYQPASQDHMVGGDWYDAILLPGKKVLLAVGDVAGHGIGAVTGMVALRNCLRGLAITGAGPAQMMTWLNTAAFHLADVTATAICAIYDPSSRTLLWARAGHLPPLVIREGTATAPPLPGGVLLGADPAAAYEEAALHLELGDAVLLFTDGLIESRTRPLDVSLQQLVELSSHPVTDISQLATSLIADAPSDTGDDACLVAVGIR